MSRIVMTGLPDPPEGRSWCAVCVMLAKAVINRLYEKEFRAVVQDGRDDDVEVAVTAPFRFQVAVTRAMSAELAQAGELSLCWTHVAGVTFSQQSPLALGNGAVPPGLLGKR